jgi:hypothetical protein
MPTLNDDKVETARAALTGVLVPATISGADEYRKIIQLLSTGMINQQIPNGKPLHAAILLEAMFKKARREMRIFSRDLAPSTYDAPELIEAAEDFLKRGLRLKVLIQDRQSASEVERRKIVRRLKEIGGMDLRFAEGAYSRQDAKHMAVMDETGYRFETDHNKTIAIANFNEPAAASELASAFDRAFAMGTQAVAV